MSYPMTFSIMFSKPINEKPRELDYDFEDDEREFLISVFNL